MDDEGPVVRCRRQVEGCRHAADRLHARRRRQARTARAPSQRSELGAILIALTRLAMSRTLAVSGLAFHDRHEDQLDGFAYRHNGNGSTATPTHSQFRPAPGPNVAGTTART